MERQDRIANPGQDGIRNNVIGEGWFCEIIPSARMLALS